MLHENNPGQDQEIQRRVYERLARLTRLERLELGHEDWNLTRGRRQADDQDEAKRLGDEDYQYNCLDMTLWSGLGVLKGLKNLRELSVVRMTTRIGVEGVRWMRQTWPRLLMIRGLNIEGEKEEEETDRRLRG